jgi:hypothetical protein
MAKSKKAVNKLSEREELERKAKKKCTCLVWFAVVILLCAIPIVNYFVPVIVGVILLAKSGEYAKPALVRTLAVLAIIVQIVVVVLKIMITYYTV